MLVTVAILSIREEVSGVVKFLYDKAYTPEDVEVIVRIDEEDGKGQDYIDNISGIHKNVRVIVGKRCGDIVVHQICTKRFMKR